jgi:succinyl-diaminopimelate desuccinylase
MIELLKRLVAAESTELVGELAAVKELAEYFSGKNIDCETDVFDDKHANASVHIKSSGEKPGLLFAAHIDVVPAEDDGWKCPPFVGVEADGKIYGRGACDMKGGIAATAAAIAEIVQEGHDLKGDIIFAATAGEETTSCGIKRFVKNTADSLGPLAGIIIPEPTNFDIVTAHRGILWLKVTTHGKTAHGSMPHLGINAITHMTSLLNALADYVPPHTEHARLGNCSMSINRINGGVATNVVPDRCSIELDIRTVIGQKHEDITGDLEKVFAQLKERDDNFSASIGTARSAEAMETDDGCEFVKSFCKVVGIGETKAVGYATDGPFLKSLNTPRLVFGPGNTGLCHKPNEYMEITDMEKAKGLYKKIILSYLT